MPPIYRSFAEQVRRAQDEALLQTLKAMFQEQCNSESTAERIRSERNHSVIDSGASTLMDAMPSDIYLTCKLTLTSPSCY